MKKLLLTFFLLVFSGNAFAAGGSDEIAKTSSNKLKVLIHDFAPFVSQQGEKIDGFEIEMWKEIARRSELEFDFVNEADFGKMLEKINNGEADVALGGISITHEREKLLDFTTPYMQSSLKLMVNQKNRGLSVFKKFIVRMGKPLIYFALFIIACGHFLWISEKGSEEAISDKYFPGVFEGMWLAITTTTTVGYGDLAPKKWSGRITAVFIMCVGISFFGWAVANMADVLDEKSYSEIIPADEINKMTIATKSNTTASAYLEKNAFKTIKSKSITEAIVHLDHGEADAIIFDEASLKYIILNDRSGNLKIASDELVEQQYGIALRQNSTIRERVNLALLQMKEDGTLSNLRKKWFAY